MQDKKKMLAAVSPLFLVSLMGLMSGCQSEVMGTRAYNPNQKTYAPDGSEMETANYAPVPAPLDDEAANAVALPSGGTETLSFTEKETETVTAPAAVKQPAKPAATVAAKPAAKHYAPFPQTFGPPTAKKSTPAVSGTKSAAPTVGGTYTVQSGDSFWKIAHKHGISTDALIAANNLSKTQKLKIGQKLVIPGGKAVASVATPKKNGGNVASREAKASGKTAQKAGAAIPADGVHVVQSGDSLWKIANRYQVSQEAIRKENNFGANPVLQVGQKIKLPRNGAAAPAAVPANLEGSAPALAGTAPADSAANFISDLGATDTALPGAALAAPAAPAASDVTSGAATDAANAAAAPAAPDLSETLTITVDVDTPIANFAKKYALTEETLRQYNVDIPENGIIPAGKSLLIPMAVQ